MKRRRAGKTELELPVVCFGAWAIGGWAWGGTDEDDAVSAMSAGIEVGMDAIDTAPVYGFGLSERLVAKAIAGRKDVKVLTKAGLRWDAEEGEPFFESEIPGLGSRMVRRNSRPESLRVEVDRSLERLGVERIDLLQIHWPDATTPIADSMGALSELRSEGKIGEIGVSNYTPAQLEEARVALGDVPLATDQPRHSLVDHQIREDGVLEWAKRHEVGLVIYSPLEQGLLTGALGKNRTFPEGDARAKSWKLSADNREIVNEAIDRVLRPIAADHEATVAQVAIAATVAREGITAALVGARSRIQALENAAAGDLALTDPERERIEACFGAIRMLHPDSRRARFRNFKRRLFGR
ncbi:MAG: aldo/keto reductase [Planctomycetota bacterium]